MNKTFKTILIYTIPLIFGIGMAILIYKLEYFGRKNIYEARVNSMVNVGPDSLTNHFPKLDLLEAAIYTKTGPEIKHEIGGGYVHVSIEKNDSLDRFIQSISNVDELYKINEDNIFNIDVDYKNRKYELTNFTDNSLYPFPILHYNKSFKDYKLIFYDFGEGKYLDDSRLKENIREFSKWKHGYTRGIVEFQEEYIMWLIIW